MANLTWWRRPSSLNVRRDVEDILDDFDLPRGFRREVDRLFDDDVSMHTLWSQMDRLFDEVAPPPTLRSRIARLFSPMIGGSGRGRDVFAPQLDVKELDGEYVLRVDLPGIRENDVHVSVDDHLLTIAGERRADASRSGRGYEYVERSYGSFTRSVELPRAADTSRVEADLRNGVLEIHVRKDEAARSRRIQIGGRENTEMAGRDEPRVIEAGSNGGRTQKPDVKVTVSG